MSTIMQQQVACNATERIVTFIATLETDLHNYKTFGDWVKKHREDVGLSQEGAADKAGISRFQWIRIENGQSGTKRSTVLKMAKVVKGKEDEALKLAGFASAEETVEFNLSGLDKRDIEDVKEFIEFKRMKKKKVSSDEFERSVHDEFELSADKEKSRSKK